MNPYSSSPSYGFSVIVFNTMDCNEWQVSWVFLVQFNVSYPWWGKRPSSRRRLPYLLVGLWSPAPHPLQYYCCFRHCTPDLGHYFHRRPRSSSASQGACTPDEKYFNLINVDDVLETFWNVGSIRDPHRLFLRSHRRLKNIWHIWLHGYSRQTL